MAYLLRNLVRWEKAIQVLVQQQVVNDMPWQPTVCITSSMRDFAQVESAAPTLLKV
jgi:hypothetical protein